MQRADLRSTALHGPLQGHDFRQRRSALHIGQLLDARGVCGWRGEIRIVIVLSLFKFAPAAGRSACPEHANIPKAVTAHSGSGPLVEVYVGRVSCLLQLSQVRATLLYNSCEIQGHLRPSKQSSHRGFPSAGLSILKRAYPRPFRRHSRNEPAVLTRPREADTPCHGPDFFLHHLNFL